MLEGDERLMFEQVVDVLTLASGEIVVADRQAARVSVFSPDGAPLRSWGGRGDGPGEFRGLALLHQGPGDSLFAFDARDDRASLFDLEGGYAREVPAAELSGDTLFTMDVWLHGRFVVEGVLTRDARARVAGALDRLPRPDGPGFRRVRTGEDGSIWVREPDAPAPGVVRWVVLDAGGAPVRAVDLPERLDADRLARDRVLGRWLGEADVNFVRTYALVDAGETVETPSWLRAGADLTAGAGAAPDSAVAVDLEAATRETVRGAAVAQEIYYSQHFRYATSTDSLELEPVDGATLHLLSADAAGWGGVVVHPDLDRLCGLGYGTGVPRGWRAGTVMCGG
ncbi:MAG: hypothetical protein ACQGVK_00330 [Myxococcota bacterium]